MKTRFSTLDVICGVKELQNLLGLRIYQIYDIDQKTYLFRLQEKDRKITLLIESGSRFHTTAYEWPKNVTPSGFTMKLRKHLKNKRIEKIVQVQSDRIVEFQFGSGEATYYVILELYDKGNIVLTDYDRIILHVLRPHHEGEEIHFVIGQKYPIRPKNAQTSMSVKDLVLKAESGQTLRNILMQVIESGSALVDHALLKYNLHNSIIINGNKDILENPKAKNKKNAKQPNTTASRSIFEMKDIEKLQAAVEESQKMLQKAESEPTKGYIIQKREEREKNVNGELEYVFHNQEYQPFLFEQFKDIPYVEFDTFLSAVDEYYFKIEHQKIDSKTLLQEREVLKKLSNVRNDHLKRVQDLVSSQTSSREKAELISNNQTLVDKAIAIIRSLLAQQLSWPDIKDIVKTAKKNNDPVASTIQQLKLEINKITLLLTDPFTNEESVEATDVDVDLSLTAWANACKYFDMKRFAAQKENKTIAASKKALKSAEKKTQQSLKDVRTISAISKARKVYWFEKFFWFISSENYLVIGGRDAQQNELVVKRYLHSSDIYVHAEIQGASSVIIKNPEKEMIPPKTLLEAGTMAISYSVSWNAKIVTNAYWVKGDQVSKTAPSGEYLPTGSFMVRGKKNFLPTCQLTMGLAILFKLEESHIEKHASERKSKRDEISENLPELTQNCMKNLEINERDISSDGIEEIPGKAELQSNNCDEDKRDHDCHTKDSKSQNEKELFDDNLQKTSIKIRNNNVNFPDTEINLNTKKVELESSSFMYFEKSTSEKCKNRCLSTKMSKFDNRKIGKIGDSDKKYNENNSKNNRGQNKKLKKLKSKYKDQDDEERQLRMKLLQSAGEKKEMEDQTKQEIKVEKKKPITEYTKIPVEHNSDNEEAITLESDFKILDALTGRPFDDDELLFAVPVVAPYQALTDYKFKLKITPGVGKRGRAAKTALSVFMSEKNCTLREKDLLKQVKEEVLARNIPGKVKLTVTQAQHLKK